MSLIGQKTRADFIEWDKLLSLTQKLERDGNWKFSLLILIGMYTGLRISDILSLKWSDLIDREYLELQEKKTGKLRKILINPVLQESIQRIYLKVNAVDNNQMVFLNRFGKRVITSQYVNWQLKEIMVKYQVVKNVSMIKSHSLRKSFGRRVFEQNDRSEKSLILLNEIFNHSNIKVTKIYLGIREQEIMDVYMGL